VLWAAASLAAHAAVLVDVSMSMPRPALSHGKMAVMSVELLSTSPAPKASMHTALPASHNPKPAEPLRYAPKAPIRTLAPAISYQAPVGRPMAKAGTTEARPSATTVMPTASSPSNTAEASAHNLDLVRRHLERFKFYPDSARRRGIGGDVDIRFRLTDGGQAVHVSIDSSSGYALLDRAAEDIVARAVPFPVDSGGYRVRLRFWP